jgi:hypothetical protein
MRAAQQPWLLYRNQKGIRDLRNFRRSGARYEPGDVVRYAKGSKTYGIEAGEYARVERVNAKGNVLTVGKQNGEDVSYDPRRLQGVTLYRETERAFSQGDRVQFTAPNRGQHIANRELGTIEKIDDSGNLRLHLDSGRAVAFNIKENPHLDYGYAVTSHSSQGQTADRVLIHVDAERAGKNSSIGAWHTSLYRVAATTRSSTPATRPTLPGL